MNNKFKFKNLNFLGNLSLKLTTIIFLGCILQTPINTINRVVAESKTVITNKADYTYQDPVNNHEYQGVSNKIHLGFGSDPLVDPLGRILGCAGTYLSDYTGFSVGVYEANPNDPTGTELGNLAPLTQTELPDITNNGIPKGKAPNIENRNPYFITNNPAGVYNFLLDPNKGQTQPGKTYILVVNPPANSIYQQRRIKIQILENMGTNNNIIRYLATSLDGQPISLTGKTTIEDSIVLVEDAENQGLDLLTFELTINMCQFSQVKIIKAGDRATAAPGDTAIYRLSIRNQSDVDLNNVVVTDNLPLGFKFLPESVRGDLEGNPVNIISEINGNNLTFRTDITLATEKVINIAYAVQLTNDAQRGTGRNSAIVNATRIDNGFNTKDGPATHQLKIRNGIVNDCGTLIGRVFIDKNFDGEQQNDELGIANAVIYLQDGNRITTDPNGLFSVANMLPGTHTGVLDLSSVPGYTFAPNHKFRERNSQSRLVRLQPGGLVRMNFAVTPIIQTLDKP
ncbi:hypothetical protein [Nodularia sp. UHCC 0506]|uniref:DUF11 domain-containing protein n=1 Tax=Nodularia sp. UHCC 0506 TaxID=3110243 RepID=UPI002B21E839|nr:hypothetical protein [Nodularia sp. UHCC 0506]MEA5516510.1 hypothetical protein [Nodularia sp. UHCC 0506]